MKNPRSSKFAKWPTVRLGDVVTDLAAGTSVNGSDQRSIGYEPAVLKISAVTEGVFKPAENKVIVEADIPFATVPPKAGHVLVSRANTPELVGASAFVHKNYDNLYLPDKLWMIEHDPEQIASAKWLHELLTSPTYRRKLRDIATGTSNSMKNISQEAFLGLRIELPPHQTQIAIADIAGTWNTAIGKTSALLLALERRKQGLMQQLLTGHKRLKGFEGKWKLTLVGAFASDVRSINTTERALPVLSCTKYAGLVDSLKYFAKQVFSVDSSTYKIVTRGQYVYATNHIEEGSIGYQDLYDAALVSPMYTVFEADAGVAHHQFLYMLLKTEAMRRVFEATTHSSVDRRGSLRWPEFAKLKIHIPPMAEQERIVEVLETASNAVEVAKQQLAALQTQKRALMQKLLSGEWQIPEQPVNHQSLSKKGL